MAVFPAAIFRFVPRSPSPGPTSFRPRQHRPDPAAVVARARQFLAHATHARARLALFAARLARHRVARVRLGAPAVAVAWIGKLIVDAVVAAQAAAPGRSAQRVQGKTTAPVSTSGRSPRRGGRQ